MDQGQQAFEDYDPTAYLPQSAFGTHLSYQASSEVMAPAYGGSYASMGDGNIAFSQTRSTRENVRTESTMGYDPPLHAGTYGVPYASMGEVSSSSTGFMAEGNNPYSTYDSTYGYGDQQPASREARNEASLGSETGQKSGLTNYLEAESQLLATQKAELEEQDTRNAHELQSTDDPVWLDFYQGKHTNEAELLRLQQQQNREELQTAYGLQHYEKFMVNNPGKSAYTYIDTVLKEETGKSRQQLSTEYKKRGASASAYIGNVLKKKTGKSQSQLRNEFSKIETGKSITKLRDEKLMREIGKTAKIQSDEKSRNKTGKSLDQLRDERVKKKTGKTEYQLRDEKIRNETGLTSSKLRDEKLKKRTGKTRGQLINEKAIRETGKSLYQLRNEKKVRETE
jgi:hypothetical protein